MSNAKVTITVVSQASKIFLVKNNGHLWAYPFLHVCKTTGQFVLSWRTASLQHDRQNFVWAPAVFIFHLKGLSQGEQGRLKLLKRQSIGPGSCISQPTQWRDICSRQGYTILSAASAGLLESTPSQARTFREMPRLFTCSTKNSFPVQFSQPQG